MNSRWLIRGLTVLLFAALAMGQVPSPKDRANVVELKNSIYNPKQVEPTDERIKSLKIPAGFKIEAFARGLGKPRMIAVSDNGHVYVTRRDEGDVVLLSDENKDGKADKQTVVAQRPKMHGIAIDGKTMYLVTVYDVYATEIAADGSLGELKRIIHDLPDGGQHQNRTLAVGPDKYLYISVGSTANATDESSPESATILRAKPDGSARTIYASGLRNTIGFAWEPKTNQLWGVDHGIDWLGDEAQREELNKIEEGKNYGWPYIHEDGKPTPHRQPPGELTHDEWKKMSVPPVLTYTAHAAPMQLVFNTGKMFPAEYQSDAFVTMHGSWNRSPPSGYEIVRIRFQDSAAKSIEPFVTGFLYKDGEEYAQFGRPVGMATMPDGSLLVSDDSSGLIYRISSTAASAQTTEQ